MNSKLDRTRSMARLKERIPLALLHARRSRGWTQADVAERIGVSQEFCARIERGTAKPSIETLAKLMHVLGISLQELLTSGDDWQPQTPAPVGDSEEEPLELRRVYRRLRRASDNALRVVEAVLDRVAKLAATRE